MRVTFIICANGLGHFNRCCQIIDRWLGDNAGLRFDLYCEQWQVEINSKWEVCKRLMVADKVVFHFHKLEGSIKWQNSNLYEFNQYESWLARMNNEVPLRDADIVVSDNLAGILSIREDCILMGSFLWSDILRAKGNKNKEVAQIVDFEKDIIQKLSPTMICVADIAMPAVMDQTESKPVPWFCERIESPSKNNEKYSKTILISSGGTEHSDNRFLDLASGLSKNPDYKIYLSARLFDRLTSYHACDLFDFTDQSFSSCDLIICRPGIGSITDSIRSLTPVIAIGEPDNPEMIHNAMRIEALGIGVDASNLSPERTLERVNEMVTDQNLIIISNILQLRTGGLQQTVNYLQNQLPCTL